MLVNHIWSFARSGKHDVSASFFQPFLIYTTQSAWTIGGNTESTYDWNTHEWSVPLHFSVSKLVHWGTLPVSITAGVRYWVKSTQNGPSGVGGRLVLLFVFLK